MTGRARGRGVARGRGTQQTADPSRRPGTSKASVPAAASQGAGEPAGGNGGNGNGNGNGAGRAALRGGAREARPGAGPVEMPTTQLSQMSLGTGDATSRRPRREISYSEPSTRPAHLTDKRGTSGTPVPLLSNYFKLVSPPTWQMYQYHVDFNPPMDSRKLRKGLLGNHGDTLFKSYLFDGMQCFSPTKLPDEVTEVFATRKYDSEKIRITIKRTGELASNSPICMQIFNIMMRQILSDLGMKEIQRAYFSQHGAVEIKAHKLEVWSGFKTSILQYEDAVLLNIDLSHKVLRTDTVLDTMYGIYHSCNQQMDRFKDMVSKKLVGQIVMTRYNDKTYRVDDIEWDVHPSMVFQRRNKEKREDEDVTYVKYYKEAYGVDVRDLHQPMLVSRPKRKDQREGAPEMLYLLPELCTMTGLTEEMRSNFGIMKDLGTHTRVEPNKRADTMMKFRRQIQANEKARSRMEGWGVKYSEELVQLTGRLLPPEMVATGATKVSAGPVADWGRELRGRLFTTVQLNNWAVIYANQNHANTKNLIDSLCKVGPPMGINFSMPKGVRLNNASTSAFLDAIRSVTNESVQMLVCVLPTNKKELYDAIKKQCCLETPIPSQCVTDGKLRNPKGLMSVVSKIAIQINCKLGGEAWALDIPAKEMMVVGIDTYHDSAKKGRSVGGFVASLNDKLTRYYSQSTMQMNHQELISTLKMSLATALKKYHSINGKLPSRIFVFRDGVGDGQLPVVVEHEVKQLLQAPSMIGSDYNPKISVIVVKKRISARFFSKAGRDLANPGPGTIIDNTATRPESYDFFIISQSVRQGTVTPTHYNVIWDESGFKPDHIQKLSYKLCHLYYNWPGTIRVPAPCQYAHKLAFLTGQSLHKQHHMSLADKLFYL